MALFKQKQKDPRYHIPNYRSEWHILRSTIEDLERWASDPNYIEKDQRAAVLAERLAQEEALRRERAEKRARLQEDPFDPRNESSAGRTPHRRTGRQRPVDHPGGIAIRSRLSLRNPEVRRVN
jgi:hypothetical protein